MTAPNRHHRRTRRRPGPTLAGTLLAAGIALGGYVLLVEEPAGGVDLDREERREAASSSAENGAFLSDGGAIGGSPAALPVDPPFVPDGMRLEYTILENGPQAAVYGLDPSRARSWGFVSWDGSVTRETLVEAIEGAGGVPGVPVPGADGSEFTNIVAEWRGFVLHVTMHAGRTVTLSLVDVG